ncbi:hypothetical protein E2C01_063220 [Portunus trituberculatus]|uniref:Uncharacterized protein n=1 Tax=Portunus trituberculatus TaxID=210409 RepID=A0A5B7HID4_PORTR|nr:hypothetical protein [Portunus trituberculatus]
MDVLKKTLFSARGCITSVLMSCSDFMSLLSDAPEFRVREPAHSYSSDGSEPLQIAIAVIGRHRHPQVKKAKLAVHGNK